MDKKEQIEKEALGAWKQSGYNSSITFIDGFIKGATRLPHLQKPVESEWISVEDRLPIDNKPILLYQKVKHSQFKQVIGAYDNGKFNSYESEFNDDLYKGYYNKITHWMPLPQPPKNNSNN